MRPRKITDAHHPACGELGLFAAKRLPANSYVLDYVGLVTRAEEASPSSEYVMMLGDEGELAIDAEFVGNEARCINDFRNTGKTVNVKLELREDPKGSKHQSVYVGSRDIQKGEELLLSYGKAYWRERVGHDMDAFILKRPTAAGTPSIASANGALPRSRTGKRSK